MKDQGKLAKVDKRRIEDTKRAKKSDMLVIY